MSPLDRVNDDASSHFDTSNRSYRRDGQQAPTSTTPNLSHVISDSDEEFDDESFSKSSFSNSKTALR